MSELCICQIYDGISEGYHYVESLDKHDNKIRADVIDEVLFKLKSKHMIRTCEDDFVARVEVPFYRELYKEILELKEKSDE